MGPFPQAQQKYGGIGENFMNASLVAPEALAHRLQRRTACNT